MRKRQIILLMAILAMACKKPYNPTVINSPKSYLIVEGTINGNDTTTIKVSRSVNLSSKTTDNPIDASVSIESDNGDNYALYRYAPGVYKLKSIELNHAHKYRLHIVTPDNNNEYRSDYVEVKDAPPIDSLGFSISAKGIQIYANTHDPANNTKYYRYNYVETWKFHSLYYSDWVSDGTNIVPRTPAQQVYYCYANNISNPIILASSARLSQDIIFRIPIVAIEATSEKLNIKYSILLRQYALTADAFKFWEMLKKNTEQLGSIFDAQPTELAGNIHNVKDNSDVVIGYISAGSIAVKRIFIDNRQLPGNFYATYPYSCQLDSLWYQNPHTLTGTNDVKNVLVPGIQLAVSAFYKGASSPVGFVGAGAGCVDCTLRGTTKQPDFWQ